MADELTVLSVAQTYTPFEGLGAGRPGPRGQLDQVTSQVIPAPAAGNTMAWLFGGYLAPGYGYNLIECSVLMRSFAGSSDTDWPLSVQGQVENGQGRASAFQLVTTSVSHYSDYTLGIDVTAWAWRLEYPMRGMPLSNPHIGDAPDVKCQTRALKADTPALTVNIHAIWYAYELQQAQSWALNSPALR